MQEIRLLTVNEAAERLNVSASHVYKMMRRGEITHIKMGKIIRISENALHQFITSNTLNCKNHSIN